MTGRRAANDPAPGSREHRPAGISRLAVAVALSLALHALVVLALWRTPRAIPRPPRREIPFELLPVPPSRAPPRAAPERTGRIERAPAPGGRRERAENAEPLVRSPFDRLRASGQDGQHGPPAALAPGDAGVNRSWFRGHGLGGAAPDPLAVAPPATMLDRGGPEDERARVQERLEGEFGRMRADELSRYPDASWLALRDGLADGFHAGPDPLHGGEDGGEGGLGGRLAFATEVRMAPLVPVAGFGFDATFRPTGASYPLKRTVRTRVELRSVRDARAAG